MKQFFIDRFTELKQFEIESNDCLLSSVLGEQNKDRIDSNRFFLEYLPQSELDKYDFNNAASLKKFRNDCCRFDSQLKPMCACNLDKMDDDIRYYGLKISDPNGTIYGSFDIRNGIITYSPIFPHVYEERDIGKFANVTYFTPMTFDEIMREQIEISTDFYVHTGDYQTLKERMKNGEYILEKISKNQMLDFVTQQCAGEKVRQKALLRRMC